MGSIRFLLTCITMICILVCKDFSPKPELLCRLLILARYLHNIYVIERMQQFRVKPFSFSHDGKRFLSGSYDQTIRIWDASSCEPVYFVGHSECLQSVTYFRDGKRFVSGPSDDTVRTWIIDEEKLERYTREDGWIVRRNKGLVFGFWMTSLIWFSCSPTHSHLLAHD